jgi:hypothetical protein
MCRRQQITARTLFIPRLDRLDTSESLPLTMIMFVSQFRPLFDAEVHVPKRLDLGEFGDLADYLHIALGKQLRLEFTSVSRRSRRPRPGVDMTGAELMTRGSRLSTTGLEKPFLCSGE